MKPTNRPAFSSPTSHPPAAETSAHVCALPSSPPRPRTPPPAPDPPLRGTSKGFLPSSRLGTLPFATSLTPLPAGKPLHHTRHIVACLALPYVRLSFSLSHSIHLPLSLCLSFCARASHIGDSSHTVAEVGGIACQRDSERSLGFHFFFIPFFSLRTRNVSADCRGRKNGQASSRRLLDVVRVLRE